MLLEKSSNQLTQRGNNIGRRCLVAACVLLAASGAHAQNRGVYPLGMSALNSGITPAPGFTYTNQFLYYSRDEATDDHGNTLPVTGQNYVAMDMNSLVWVTSIKPILGARYSATATLPFAKNDLTSDVQDLDYTVDLVFIHGLAP